MKKWLSSVWFCFRMRRLGRRIHKVLCKGNVRQLRELADLMRQVGEKHDIESWREMAAKIDVHAEQIVTTRDLSCLS